MGNQNNKDDHDHHNRTDRRGSGAGKQDGEDVRHTRQIDDNQDDLGRDVNQPDKTSNDINRRM